MRCTLMQHRVSLYDDVSATTQERVASNSIDAGWGELGNKENITPEKAQAMKEIGEEVIVGALKGDFNDDPTFWSDVGQIVTGLIPVAGQARRREGFNSYSR